MTRRGVGPAARDTGPAADLADRLAMAGPQTLGRLVLAVAALHEPDGTGRCRWCRPERWRWWRGTGRPCPTRRVMAAELQAGPPQWTSA